MSDASGGILNELELGISWEHAPLVLAGVEFLHPIFREATTYQHLLEQGLTGNPEGKSAQQLHSDLNHRRLIHSKYGEQLSWKEKKEQSDESGAGEAKACSNVYGSIGALGFARTKVLPGHGRGRTHQSDCGPRNERKQFRIRNRESSLCSRTLCQ